MCKDSSGKIDSLLKDYDGRKLSPTDLEFHKKELLRIDDSITKRKNDAIKITKKDSLIWMSIIDSFQKIRTHHDTLILSQSKINKEYQELSKFKERCTYIIQATEHRWNKYSPNQEGGWETFAGWLITALAISLGAPFWFDLLSKLIRIRGSGGVSKDTTPSAVVNNSPTAPVQTINVNTNTNPEEGAVG